MRTSILAAALLLLAAFMFFWIPGIGLVLAFCSMVMFVLNLTVPRVAVRDLRYVVFGGAFLAGAGLAIIPFIDVILGTLMFLGGCAVMGSSPLLEWLAARIANKDMTQDAR